MTNRTAQALDAGGTIDLEAAGERKPATVSLGVTQRTESPASLAVQSQTLQTQRKQVELLQQQNNIVGSTFAGVPLATRLPAANEAKPRDPPADTPSAAPQAFDGFSSTLLKLGSMYLSSLGVLQAPQLLEQAKAWFIRRGAAQPEGGAEASGSVQGGGWQGAGQRGGELYPLGADAQPAPHARVSGHQQILAEGVRAGKVAGAGALIKGINTALTASNPVQAAEGGGAAIGGFGSTVLGAMVASRFKWNVSGSAMTAGFVGDKLGGEIGKRAMLSAANDPAAPAAVAAGAPPSAATTLWGALASVVAVGGGAAAFQKLGQYGGSGAMWAQIKGWMGKGNAAKALDAYPLGADAGPSPTGIAQARAEVAALNRPGMWKGLLESLNSSGKVVGLEAGLKAIYTYTTARTAEEKGAGYGGAIGGAIGSIAGAYFLRMLGPDYGALIGSTVGDKVGTVVGGKLGKYIFDDPLPAVSLMKDSPKPEKEVFDAQLGVRVARGLMSPAAGAHSTDSEDGSGQLLSPQVPPAPAVLPSAPAAPPPQPASAVQPVTQQLTFTANVPVTVQGSIDAPNQLAQQLEEAVRRVMLDLQRQAQGAQLADPAIPL